MANVKILLTEYCLNCPNLDIEDNIDRLYSGNDVYMAFGNITCSHMKVCNIVNTTPRKPSIDLLLDKNK